MGCIAKSFVKYIVKFIVQIVAKCVGYFFGNFMVVCVAKVFGGFRADYHANSLVVLYTNYCVDFCYDAYCETI